MQAQMYLKLASVSDLVENGKLIENRVHFYRSVQTEKFEGPYTFFWRDPDTHQIEMQVMLEMIYVPWYRETPETVEMELNFRLALPEDLKEQGALRTGYSYFLLVDGKITGPYLLTALSNTKDIAGWLKAETLYVICEKSLQQFKLLNAG
ncbi:hypothetical protein [Flavobacterium psychrotrophum]|uniref:hypothetical protein n=1 Tax=Flavobacterium psychrotrophum TaxID=2294119 RepID=UPI000E30CF26|nr:hypothetical protein [Flavobacterium psychrotrophum]